MAIRGSLGEATLADVLQLLALGRKTGCLSVFEGQKFGRIYLHAGRVVFASIVNRKDRLGDILLKAGAIDQRSLDAAIARQSGQNPMRLGELLIEAGAISREELRRFIMIQVEEAVYFLFSWSSGSFHFEAGEGPDPSDILVSINTEHLLLEGARRVDEWTIIRKKIPSLDVVFARTSGVEADPSELTAVQGRILPMLDGHRNVREIIELSGLLEFEAFQALFGLLQAGLCHGAGKKESAGRDDVAPRAEELENLAAALYQTEMLDEAEKLLHQALALDPSRVEARFRLAAIDMRRGAYREGARRLMDLISDGRLAPSIFLNLALCLEAMGRLEHALLTVEEGLRGFAGHERLLLSRAILLTKLKKPRAATRTFEAYRAALTRAAQPPAAYFIFSSLALAAVGALSDAAARADEGLTSFPRQPVLLLHAAVIHERMDHGERATALFQQALRLDPTSTRVRRGFADTLYRAGKYEDAAELYRGLLEEGGGAEVHFRLGAIAYERGDRADAISYWRGALQNDPGHLQARARLRLIDADLPVTQG